MKARKRLISEVNKLITATKGSRSEARDSCRIPLDSLAFDIDGVVADIMTAF